MANRTIELTLKADVGRLVAGLKTARDAVNAAGRDVAGFVRNNERDLQTFGTAMTTAGAGLLALTVGATKAAIDWETAWAGVQKTNDGTAEQMQRLEEDLRNLAKTLPASHAEIAAVAEAAGQLGVSVDDVADFTLTMINMGETTNLSADEAATGIARFSNVMGTAWSDADRLGSTIVGLGNNFATTEAEILSMAQRIAPVGRIMNMTEADTLAMATAMSSVGIEAEAGGTAISMVMRKIDAAVREGGESLTDWAAAAGVSADEFATAWQTRPAEAMQILSQGLGETANAGGDVAAILSDLGVKGVRESATMLSLASASGLLTESLELGAQAWEENSALAEEAEVRYATAEAKISVAWNNIMDAAITAGASIAPVVGEIADGVADLAGWFGDLPAPVLGAVTALSGVAGVTSLAAGGLLMLAPRAVETWDAFQRLKASTRGVPSAIRGIGKAGLYAAAGLAALSILRTVAENAVPAAKGVEEVTAALIDLNNTGSGESINEIFQFGEMRDEAGQTVPVVKDLGDALRTIDIGGADDAMTRMGEHLGSFNATVIGIPNNIKRMNEQFAELDSALTGMPSEEAAIHMRNLRDEAEAAGRQDFSNWADLQRVLPEYAASIQDMANATGTTYTETELLEMAMGKLPPVLQQAKAAADQAANQDNLVSALDEVGLAADGTVESLSEYLDLLFATGLAVQSHMQASASYAEALEGVDDSIKTINKDLGGMGKVLNESKDGFDVTTEAGRLAQASFLDVASSGQDLATSMANAGKSQEDVQASLQTTYDDLVKTAQGFGMSKDEAEDLTRAVLGIPHEKSVEAWIEGTAKETLDEITGSLDAIPEAVYVIAEMDASAREEAFATAEAIDLIPKHEKVDVAVSENGTAGQVQARIDSVTGKTEYVFVTEDGTTTTVQQQIMNIDGVTRHVYVDDAGTVYMTQKEIDGVRDGSSTITVTGSGISSVDAQISNAARNRTSTITVTTTQRINRLVTQQRDHPFIMNPGGYKGGRASRDFGFRRLPHLANGGRLPYTGLGTDMILGVSSLGHPVAMLDDGEWTINRRSSDKYDSVLDRINRDHPSVQHLAHLRDGGRASGHEWSAGSFAPPAVQVTTSAPEMPSELVGTLYLDNGAFAGQVRMAFKDQSVVRAASQSLAAQGARDVRGTGGR